MRRLGIMLSLLLLSSPVGATYYFASPSGGDSAVCTDIDSTDIAVRPSSYGTISRAAECATVAGDKVVVRGGLGTYTGATHQVDLQTLASTALASGTSDTNMTEIMADPADAMPAIEVNGWYVSYTPVATSVRHWIRISGLDLSAGGGTDNVIMLAGTHLLVEDNIIHNSQASCVFSRGDAGDAYHTIRDNELYDCGIDGNGYGVYAGADDAIVENNNIHDTYGQGGQFLWAPKTGGARRSIFRYNYVHDVIKATISTVNGCLGWAVSGGDIEIYGNVFDMTSCSSEPSLSTGISLLGTNASNTKIHNNMFIGTSDEVIYVGPFGTSTGATIYNNVMDFTAGVAIRTANSSTYTATYNACRTADNCATANKIVITALTDITVSTSDFRHKATSLGLNAGTSVSTRTCVGACDLGPYEQPVMASMTIDNTATQTLVDVTFDAAVPPLSPSTGLTTFTVQCTGTNCGTPVAEDVRLRSGSQTVAQLTVTRIGGTGFCTSSSQTWTATLASSNFGDSRTIGSLPAQQAAAFTTQPITIICTGTGGTVPASPYLYYKLNDAAGALANDETANNRDGAVVGTPTWTTPVVDGYGLYFPNDGVDRSLDILYGNTINPTTQSFTVCASYKLDSGVANKIVVGTANGTSQRLYAGTYTGTTWQLGVQGSSYSATGESEFPVVYERVTRICIGVDSTTDQVVLVVDGVKGTSAASLKSTTTYTLASDLAINCGASTTFYCGGLTVDEVIVWDRFLTAQEFIDDYETFNFSASGVPCYGQAAHRGQLVALDTAGDPINYGAASGTLEVVDGGGIAVIFQLDCTGSNGGAITVVPRYSTDGSTFALTVPNMLGAGGVAMWGSSFPGINNGTATCCVSGALSANHGTTIVTSVVSPAIDLAQNHSYAIRYIFRFSTGLAGQSRYFKLYQDNGEPLAGGYTPSTGVRVDLVNPRSSAGIGN